MAKKQGKNNKKELMEDPEIKEISSALTEMQRSVLIKLCEFGKGLTYSAQKIGISAKRITEIIKNEERLMSDVQDSMLRGMDAILRRYENVMADQRIADAAIIERKIESFVSNITLWDSFDVELEVETILLKSRELGGNIYEVATGFGKHYHEIMFIISENPELSTKLLNEDD